jgi:hypothetical protein
MVSYGICGAAAKGVFAIQSARRGNERNITKSLADRFWADGLWEMTFAAQLCGPSAMWTIARRDQFSLKALFNAMMRHLIASIHCVFARG